MDPSAAMLDRLEDKEREADRGVAEAGHAVGTGTGRDEAVAFERT